MERITGFLRLSKVHRDEKGVVLIIAIALLAVLVMVGTFVVKTTTTDIAISGNTNYDRQAFYAAEAGASRARGKLNAVSGWLGSLSQPDTVNVFAGDNTLGTGTSYHVTVDDDNPSVGKVLISSTGYVTNDTGTVSTAVVEVVLEQTSVPYTIFDYAAFGCSKIKLKGGSVVTGGHVFGNGEIELENSSGIVNGNVYGRNKINIGNSSNILNGSIFADGNIDLEDSASVGGNVSSSGDIDVEDSAAVSGNAAANGDIDVENGASIDGDATAGGTVTNNGTIGGSTQQNVLPLPVAAVNDLCAGSSLSAANFTLTSDVIGSLTAEAAAGAQTVTGNYTYSGSDNYSGVVHVTGDFHLTGIHTFSSNVIYVVDGKVQMGDDDDDDDDDNWSLTSSGASTVTFVVPSNKFKAEGSGTLDGAVLLGTLNTDGSNVTGGKFAIDGDDDDDGGITINGSGVAVIGGEGGDDDDDDDDDDIKGEIIVNHVPPVDPHLLTAGTYTVISWQEK